MRAEPSRASCATSALACAVCRTSSFAGSLGASGAREFEEGFTAAVLAEAVCVRRRECVAGVCGSENLPFGNPAESKQTSRLPSALRPRLAPGVPFSVEFQRRRARSRLPRCHGRPLLLKGASADAPTHKAESGRNTFHRDYKPHGQTLSTSILPSLTEAMS